MKKIPTLFVRRFENHKVVEITDEVTNGMEWVLQGEGVSTIKWDGSCCAIINGELYKRYDAKKGKKPPAGAIPCQDQPDPITGHFPHWVKCDRGNPADRWFWNAFDNAQLKYAQVKSPIPDGTYEAIGNHFQGNPYGLNFDTLMKHGRAEINADLTSFEKIKKFLSTHKIEGVVFWKDGEPRCKIKRSDFGLKWGNKE